MKMFSRAYNLFIKDLRSELRTRYAINALIMFILVAISVILFSIGNEKIPPQLTAGLYWVVIFFSAMSGLSRAFVSEEEKGTTLTLQLVANADIVFSGKLLFNLSLTFFINLIITFLYAAFFEDFVINNFSLFLITFFFGNIGLAISSTIIASIIAKAGAKGTLYPVLSFPILLPLILTCVQLTIFCFDGINIENSVYELAIVISYDIVMITISYLLFDFIWKE